MEGHGVSIVELADDESGGYRLNTEKLKEILLRSDVADKKVAVISVAGAFRKGKSFLLNFFVHYLEWLEAGGYGDEWFHEETVLDKFRWRGGSECDTLGIILWSKPYFLRDSQGKEVVVFLIDTQGLFDNKSTIQHCVSIFAMSTLLSSVQIFNLSNQIQEDDLQNLRLFTEFARLAQKDGTTTSSFQKLLFLVRDWPNSEELDYGFEGGDEYMGNVLKVTKRQKPELQTVRKNLTNSFETMQCFLMPYPGQNIAKNNSQKVLGEIDDDFKEQIGVFVPSIFDEAAITAKSVAGREITCSDLFNLFKIYIEVFKSGKLPRPRSIFESTVQSLNLVAEESGKTEYNRVMEKFMANDPELTLQATLLTYHSESSDSALKMFESKPKLGSSEVTENHRENLNKRFDDLTKQVDERRKAKEEEERLAEEKRVVEEENWRIEQENREMEEKNKRILKEKERIEEDARRKEQDFQHKEKIMQHEQELVKEHLRRQEHQMEQDRAKSEAEKKQLLEEQGKLRDQMTALANRPPQVIRERGGGGFLGIIGQVVGAVVGGIFK